MIYQSSIGIKNYQIVIVFCLHHNVLSPFTLNCHKDVKNMLKDYQGALEDFDKVDVLEPKNDFTLNNCGGVKNMFDYQGTMEDFDKANVLESNIAFILNSLRDIKNILKNYQGAL